MVSEHITFIQEDKYSRHSTALSNARIQSGHSNIFAFSASKQKSGLSR
jgi:hypothetical protein